MQKPLIDYSKFDSVDIRVGTILACEKLENSPKLLKLEVDFGSSGKREILTGMQKFYEPETFIGLQTLFLINLEPKKMAGLVSHGMLLSVGLDHEKKPILIKLSETAENGDGVS